MPAAIPALIVGVVQGGLAVYGGGAFLAAFVKGVLVTAALTGASKLLQKKPELQDTVRNRNLIVRSAMSPHRSVVGEPPPVSGTLVFAGTQGDKNEYLYLVIALTGHEVSELRDVWLDDRRIPHEQINSNGTLGARGGGNMPTIVAAVHGQNLQSEVLIKRYVGSDSQSADATMTAAFGSQWTSNHRLRGRAYVVVRLRNNQSTNPFPTGIPNIKVAIKGAKLYDPRDGVTRYSNNPALVVRHYLTSPAGLACVGSEIDDASVTAAANICDERVAVEAYTSPQFNLNPDWDQLEFVTRDNRLGTGDGVRINSAGLSGTGLSTGVTYYLIRTSGFTAKLATTPANAHAGVAINITALGAGPNTLSHIDQARYSCDGTWDADQSPRAVLDSLLTSMAGMLVYSGGVYQVHAGAYTPPSVSIGESDLRGAVQFTPKPARSELFNALRPVYADTFLYGQVTDAPIVAYATFETQDGGVQVVRDYQLSFTTNPIRAQRIAKAGLTRSRKGTLTLPCKLSAFRLQVNDVVQVNLARLGFSAKTFRIVGWKMAAGQDGIGVDLTLSEEASADWGWTAAEGQVNPLQDELALPSQDVAAPFTVQAFSGGAEVLRAGDGTIISRMRVTWQAPAEPNLSGYEVRYKRMAEATYTIVSVPPDATVHTIAPVKDGDAYDLAVRAMGIGPARSEWTSIQHTVVGKTAPPGAPSNLTATSAVDAVVLKWTNPTDQDLAGVEVWESAVNDRNQALLLDTVAGNTYTRSAAGASSTTRRYWVRARDTSDNVSPFFPLGATAGIAGTPNNIPASTIPRLASLPANNADYNLVLLDTDEKLYRWDGLAWVSWVDGSDILASSVTTGKLAANSVVAGKIAANAIVAGDGVIGSLAVQTLQLANQAVTIPTQVSFTGPTGNISGATDLFSLAFVSTGAPVFVIATVVARRNMSSNDAWMPNIRIRRTGANGAIVSTPLQTWVSGLGINLGNTQVGLVAMIADTPGAGNVVYTVQGGSGFNSCVFQNGAMFALETKK